MIPELWLAALWLAASLSLVALLATRLGARADLALAAASALTLVAAAAMLWCFDVRDFSVAAVNDHGHRLRPTADALGAWFATWGGAVFLWAVALAVAGLLLAWTGRGLRGHALLLLLSLAALLLLGPFARVELPPVEGRALGMPGLMPWVGQVAFAVACAVSLVVVAAVRARWALRVAVVGAAIFLVGVGGWASGEVRTVVLRPGATATVQGVELVLRDVRPAAGPDYTAIEARLGVGGDVLPAQLRTYISRPVEMSAAAVDWSIRGEVEARLLGRSDDGRWRVALVVRPLAWALWLGGGLAISAGILALIALPPASRRTGSIRPLGWALGGLVGYVLTGEPLTPSRPAPPLLIDAVGPAAFAEARQELPGVFGDPAAWITIAEALERGGSADDAVSVLLTGIERSPDNAELWTALGNALALHAEGSVPPAAQLAYARAARIAPDSVWPRYNEGLAWMLAGDPRRAVAAWEGLRGESDAPWRAALDRRLAGAQAGR